MNSPQTTGTLPHRAESVLIRGAHVVGADVPPGTIVDVYLADGRVEAVGADAASASAAEVVDGRGLWLLPGWIDVQVNDAEWMMRGPAAPHEHAARIRRVLEYQASLGVTGICLATLAAPIDEIVDYLEGMAAVRDLGRGTSVDAERTKWDGIFLGGLVEGTFMNPAHCGAHNPQWVVPPSLEVLQRFTATGGVRLLNVAAEMGDEAVDVIRAATARGITCGIGHAKPHAVRLREAVDAGLRYVIHLGNGPTGSNLKSFNDGGMLEESLRNDDIMITVIVDGYHVHFDLVRDWLARKGSSRFIAVSDAGFALSFPSSEFEAYGVAGRVSPDGRYLEVLNAADSNPFSSDRSNLFGAAIHMNQVFENVVNLVSRDMQGVYYREHQALPIEGAMDLACQVCATNPARLLGLDDRGVLTRGARSDAVLLSMDGAAANYRVVVKRVWLGG